MADFENTILKVISDYKAILRKTLPVAERTTKVQRLGIKRKYIREMSEVDLYSAGQAIVCELKKDLGGSNKSKNSNNVYEGSREFLFYIEDFLSKHRIEAGKIVHVGIKASCALVNAIQLIAFSGGQLRGNEMIQVKKYVDVIAACGNDEQKKMLVEAVNSHQAGLMNHLPEEIARVAS